MNPISQNYIDIVSGNLESLCDTMDSISEIEASATTDFSTKRNEFFAKSDILDTISGPQKHDAWFKKTLDGFKITREHVDETLDAAMRILSSDTVSPNQKTQIAKKVAMLHDRLEYADDGLIRMQGSSTKDPRRYLILTHSMLEFREGAEAKIREVEHVGQIQRPKATNKRKHLGLGFGVSINELPPDIRSEYIKILATEIKKTDSEGSPYLAMANEYFYKDFPGAKLKARALHQQFKIKNGKADSHENIVKPTAAQFSAAMKILHEQFPGYTECAYNDNQRVAVANLLQIILCGEDLNPDSEFCIQIKETEDKATEPYETDFPGDKSYAMHRIDIFESRKDNVPSASMMRNKKESAANGFNNDFVQELLIQYEPVQVNDLVDGAVNVVQALTSLQDQGIVANANSTIDSIFPEAEFTKVFEKFLSAPLPKRNWESSDQAENVRKKLVEKLSKGVAFSDLVVNEIASDLNLAIPDVREEISKIWPQEKREMFNDRAGQVQKLIKDTTLTQKDIDSIVEKSGCKPEEAEPLLRLLALDTLISRVAQETDRIHFEHNLHASIGSFTKDCIDRTLNNFTIGDEPKLRLGKESGTNLFQRISTSYLAHLTKNTPDAALQIDELNRSDLLESLNTLNLPSSDSSNFSEEAFLKILEPHLKAYAPKKSKSFTENEQKIYDALTEKLESEQYTKSIVTDIASDLGLDSVEVKDAIDRMWEPVAQKRFNQLMGAVVYSRIPQEQLSDLSAATGRPPKEIEPLLRLKFIQMMGLMNQSVMAHFTTEIVPITFLDYQHPADTSYTHNAPPAGIDNTFRFTPDFRGLTYEPVFKFQFAPSQLELEGRADPFARGATIASTGESKFTITDFSSTAPATNRQLSDLNISWKSPVAYAQHLASLIDPSIQEKSFRENLHTLKWTPWPDIDLSVQNAATLNEEYGIKGSQDINARIDRAFISFTQWSNANATGSEEVATAAEEFVNLLRNIALDLPDAEAKGVVTAHINKVIGQILDVEENRLDNMLKPIASNPGRGTISLQDAIENITRNDCQYLTPKRAKSVEKKIQSTVQAYKKWSNATPKDTSAKKAELIGILQRSLRVEIAETIDKETPEYITSLFDVVANALKELE